MTVKDPDSLRVNPPTMASDLRFPCRDGGI